MSSMTKLLCLVSLILLTLCVSTACNIGNNGNNSNAPNDSENNTAGGEGAMDKSKTHYHESSEIMFISADDVSCKDASYKLLVSIDKYIIGKNGYAFTGFLSELRDNEVIVGYVPEREISVRAYELLNEIKSESNITESRYLVYAEGGKLAIAYEKNPYTSAESVGQVVDLFIDKFVEGKNELLLQNGVVMSGALNLIDVQKLADAENDRIRWEKIYNTIGDEDIYLAFRSFFEQMYSDEIVALIASYYDPASGIFYSSASGKKAEGIYPNPEATSMILSYVLNSGMLNNMGVRYLIPDLARYKIIYYLKSIQDKNGEFYVSQMKKSSIDSNRLGRDRSACVGLLDRLAATPTYSVAGMVGDGISGEEYWADLVAKGLVTEEEKPVIYWAESPLERAGSLSESVASAVARVVATSSGTEQFESHEAFIKWLLAKDPYNNPYTAMSNTSSAASLIYDWSEKLGGYKGENTTVNYGAKSFDLYSGETLNEILIRWMNSHINEAGLFGKVTDNYNKNGDPVYDGFYGGWGYQNSNGFFKAIGRYTYMQLPYPEPRKAAESLLLGINSDEPVSGNILVIYNVWSSLNSLRTNVKKYYGGSDKEEILELIENGLKKQVIIDAESGETKAYAAIAIDKCAKKIMAFKKSDGGFGHAIEYSTPNWQGGLLVAVSKDNLSDIDAITCSSNSLGNALSELFGFSLLRDVPMNNNADLLLFLEVMSNQEYVVKVGPTGEVPEK